MGAVTAEGSSHGLGGGKNAVESLDLFENDLSMVSIRNIRRAIETNDKLRVVSVYNNRGVDDSTGQRNDKHLDNLVSYNIFRYKEDKAIKNLVIWHKRMYKKSESRLDYDHFLEIQFGVIKDEYTGDLYEIDHSKLAYRNREADNAHAQGAISVQPSNPMNSLGLKPEDSLALATAPTRKPHIVVDIWEEDPISGQSMESRLLEAWGMCEEPLPPLLPTILFLTISPACAGTPRRPRPTRAWGTSTSRPTTTPPTRSTTPSRASCSCASPCPASTSSTARSASAGSST
jgi:hypothetical protein